MQKGVDYIGNGVVYFCHDGKGNFIMGKRSAKARDEQGNWDIGGGGVELGDSVEETVKKEIMEEYGAKVLNLEFLGFRDVHRQYQGKPTHWIVLDFKVLIDALMVKNGEPHKMDAVEWFTFDSMPKMKDSHSQWPIFLEKYKEKLFTPQEFN